MLGNSLPGHHVFNCPCESAMRVSSFLSSASFSPSLVRGVIPRNRSGRRRDDASAGTFALNVSTPTVHELCQDPFCFGTLDFCLSEKQISQVIVFSVEVVRTRRAFRAAACAPKAGTSSSSRSLFHEDHYRAYRKMVQDILWEPRK